MSPCPICGAEVPLLSPWYALWEGQDKLTACPVCKTALIQCYDTYFSGDDEYEGAWFEEVGRPKSL